MTNYQPIFLITLCLQITNNFTKDFLKIIKTSKQCLSGDVYPSGNRGNNIVIEIRERYT